MTFVKIQVRSLRPARYTVLVQIIASDHHFRTDTKLRYSTTTQISESGVEPIDMADHGNFDLRYLLSGFSF